MIPLHLCAPADEALSEYRARAKLAIEDSEEREEASEQRSQVRQIFATFNMPYLSLPVTTTKVKTPSESLAQNGRNSLSPFAMAAPSCPL
jgi:hypothetical protein